MAAFAAVLGLAVLAGFASGTSGVVTGAAFTAAFAVSFGDGATMLFLAFLRRRTPKDPIIIFPLFDFLSPLPIFFEILNCEHKITQTTKVVKFSPGASNSVNKKDQHSGTVTGRFIKFADMATRKLWIYSPEVSPRLEYAAGVIFSTVLGINYEITTDRRKIGGSPAVFYTNEKVKDQFVIRPSGLLDATGVEQIRSEVSFIGEMPVLFAAEGGSIPFDLFSAVFYMLSRYEEYLPFSPDAHGRFPGAASLAGRGGFLRIPVVEIWSKFLAIELIRRYPVLTIRHNEYSALVTVDVDQPFAYRSRGFLRSMGGLVKGLAGVGARPADRIRTMTGELPDPYDSFGYIEEKLKESQSEALFFFPTGDQGEYDHNPPFRDHDYGEIIRRYDRMYGSGLHSSYRSAGRIRTLKTEAERYSAITGHPPVKVRQHWLLLNMPDTYRDFREAGMTHDYTMGYHDEPGFRAGIARPFPFYDLATERATTLTVVPFQVMDVTLRQYLHLQPEAALEVVRTLIAATRNAGGLFVSIWHNTSLNEGNGWEGWRHVFEEMLFIQKI